jgi:hypothetical protein
MHPDVHTYYVLKDAKLYLPLNLFCAKTLTGIPVQVKLISSMVYVYINNVSVFWSAIDKPGLTYSDLIDLTRQWFYWPEELEIIEY